MTSSSATNLASVREAKKHLTSFLKKQQTLPTEILEREAPRIQAEARMYTPFKSGKLEASVWCRVSKSITRPGLNIRASARNGNFNYAGVQHENTYYTHPVKGRDHYLSIPFYAGVSRIKQQMRREVRYND